MKITPLGMRLVSAVTKLASSKPVESNDETLIVAGVMLGIQVALADKNAGARLYSEVLEGPTAQNLPALARHVVFGDPIPEGGDTRPN